ncbi:MAG: SCO family protein [Solirubrobacteraceae bacterium]
MSSARSGTDQRGRLRLAIEALPFVALVLLAAACGTGVRRPTGAGRSLSPGAAQFAGPLFPAGLRASPFTLVDQNGRRATLSEYRGRVLVVSFMYSHCRDACPLMATEIRGALDQLPGGGHMIPVLAISVDPAHDSRASARAFLAREHLAGRMRFLLGAPQQLQRVWKRYAVAPEFGRSGHPLAYGHSAFVMLIDRRGLLRVGFPAGQLVPEDLAHDLRLLLGQRT